MKRNIFKLFILFMIIIFPNKILANEYSSDFFVSNITNHIVKLEKQDISIRFMVVDTANKKDYGKIIFYTVANPKNKKNMVYFKVNYYDENKSLVATCDSKKVVNTSSDSNTCEVLSKNYKNSHEIKYYRVFIDINKKPKETKDIIYNGEIISDEKPSSDYINGYTIKSFDVSLVVDENNTIYVTEEILVLYEDNKEKKDILRYLNIVGGIFNENNDFYINRSKISNIEINDKYFKTYDNGKIKIIINSDNSSLKKKYIIKYKLKNDKDRSKKSDIFYYSLNGDKIDNYIENFTFNIKMPKEINKSNIKFINGLFGQEEIDDIEYDVKENNIVGRYTRILLPKHELALKIDLDEGYFKTKNVNYSNIIFSIIIIAFTIYSVKLFKKHGIDKEVFCVNDFFSIEKYNSLEIGKVFNQNARKEDVLSLFIYLANKGYISIHKNSKSNDFTIKKLKEYDSNKKDEKLFLSELFKNSEKCDITNKKDLTNSFYKTINKILELVNYSSKKDIIINNKVIIYIFITISLLFVNLLLNGLYLEEIIELGLFSFLALVLLIISGALLLSKIIDKNQFKNGKVSTIACLSFFITGIILLIIISYPIITSFMYLEIDFIIFIILTIISLIIMLSCKICIPKRNKKDNELLGKILGFKKYLEDLTIIEIKNNLKENPNYFYDMLPYAYVLGISKIWIKKYDKIKLKNPIWDDNNFDISEFMDKTLILINDTVNSYPFSNILE